MGSGLSALVAQRTVDLWGARCRGALLNQGIFTGDRANPTLAAAVRYGDPDPE